MPRLLENSFPHRLQLGRRDKRSYERCQEDRGLQPLGLICLVPTFILSTSRCRVRISDRPGACCHGKHCAGSAQTKRETEREPVWERPKLWRWSLRTGRNSSGCYRALPEAARAWTSRDGEWAGPRRFVLIQGCLKCMHVVSVVALPYLLQTVVCFYWRRFLALLLLFLVS